MLTNLFRKIIYWYWYKVYNNINFLFFSDIHILSSNQWNQTLQNGNADPSFSMYPTFIIPISISIIFVVCLAHFTFRCTVNHIKRRKVTNTKLISVGRDDDNGEYSEAFAENDYDNAHSESSAVSIENDHDDTHSESSAVSIENDHDDAHFESSAASTENDYDDVHTVCTIECAYTQVSSMEQTNPPIWWKV